MENCAVVNPFTQLSVQRRAEARGCSGLRRSPDRPRILARGP